MQAPTRAQLQAAAVEADLVLHGGRLPRHGLQECLSLLRRPVAAAEPGTLAPPHQLPPLVPARLGQAAQPDANVRPPAAMYTVNKQSSAGGGQPRLPVQGQCSLQHSMQGATTHNAAAGHSLCPQVLHQLLELGTVILAPGALHTQVTSAVQGGPRPGSSKPASDMSVNGLRPATPSVGMHLHAAAAVCSLHHCRLGVSP